MSKQDVIKKKSNLSFKLALCIVLLSALVLVVIYILVDTIESSAVIIIAFSIVLIVLLTFSMFIISSFSKKAKKSKKKERDAAERWRDIYAAAPIGVSFWDKDVKFIDCNDAVLEMMGFESREDYAQNYLRTWTKYQPSGLTSLEQGAQNFKKVFKQGYCHCVWTCLDAQGQAYPIECTLVRMIEDGEFKVAAYWIDLRPSREYEKKIVEAEERAQLMLDEAPIVIQYWDSDYNHIDCNRAALEFYGFTNKEEYKQRLKEVAPDTHPDSRWSWEIWNKYLEKIFREGYGATEFTEVSVKGEVHLFDVIGFRIEYNGEIVALTYSTDITQLNASIEKERLAEEFNRKLLDNAPSFMEFWDVDCNIFSCNQRMLDVFGVSNKTEFLERYYDFSPKYQPCGTLSPEKNKQMIEGARKNGRNRCEWTYILRNGEEMPVDSYFVSTTYQDTPIIICYSYDLRPIKAAMEKEHIAEEENRAKTRFLARMSHEIRTPMNAILGITETQLQKNMPAETEEAFLRIHSSSNFLLTIINDILDLSKVEAEKMEIVPAPYDITNMIVDTVQLNMVHIGNKPINFSLEVDPQIPTTLIGDELRIKQILNNMLSNAFKYTQEGQVKLSFGREASEKSVEESVEKSETIVLVVQVQDTGVGMTKEQIDKLFNVEFTRFNTPGTRAIEGSGLGMTITHRFIKLMQGTIEVNSDVGKGSIFTARIPQKFQVDSLLGTDTVKKLQNFEITQKSMKKIEKLTQDSMPYGRVLVVDDMEMNLYVAESLLEPYQISVETAVNGNGAIEKIKSGKEYDIIFMDHMMPDMDGLETTKIIRRLGYTQPIIALTANVVNSVFDLFINSGFDDIISKPINLDKFNSCLIRYIKNKHQEKGLD